MDNVWTNLGNRLETAWKRPTRPNSKRPKDGEIIDEEKSVRWNREEVVRRQKAWDAECSRLKKAQNAEIEHISEAIELQIQEDIKAKTKRSKTIYYSPVYFRPVNRGKISSTVITPLDNTGYRCCPGTSVNIFYTKEECVKCYREQVRQASEVYEKEKARIIADFDKRMVELDKSLEPFEDIPKSDYTVVAKMDVTNDSLGYNEKNRHFYLETTRTMIPTRYTIEMLKMQALIGLVDELRANTTWQKGVPFRILIRTTVFVDGIEDVSQASTESQTITL